MHDTDPDVFFEQMKKRLHPMTPCPHNNCPHDSIPVIFCLHDSYISLRMTPCPDDSLSP